LELDRPQHVHHAAHVVAQHYSSVIFAFHFRQGKFGALLKMLFQVFFSFLKITEV
jgi:hypothetical protein